MLPKHTKNKSDKTDNTDFYTAKYVSDKTGQAESSFCSCYPYAELSDIHSK